MLPKRKKDEIDGSLFEKYREAVSYVESFSNFSLRKNFSGNRHPSFFLDRTRYFLDLIGDPCSGAKYIHVTGTAGKGSVASAIHEILVADSKRAGLFTSPFATTSIEEIKVGDYYISPKDFVSIVEYLKPFVAKAIEKGPFGGPSTFEIFLAIALLYFKKEKCQWIVLEVGLGGRYDATNIIKNPKVTVITNIDYDHTEILGKNLKEIAFDKAGIIKSGSHFFTSEQRKNIKDIFRKICKEKNVPFESFPKQKSYQELNNLLATRVAQYLRIDEKSISNGLKNVRMPCRFEIISRNPLVILDGAHNRAKMRTTIYNLSKYKYKNLNVVISIANTKKDNTKILEQIIPLVNMVILTSSNAIDRKSIHPSVLLPDVMRYKKKNAIVKIIENSHEALKYAFKNAKKDDCILVTGSFFLAGELRKEWFSEGWVLKNRKSFE